MSARLRGDLSAAFAQVIAAIVDGCLDGAERRETITEALGRIGGQLGRDLSGH
jgi:hypothetical protein